MVPSITLSYTNAILSEGPNPICYGKLLPEVVSSVFILQGMGHACFLVSFSVFSSVSALHFNNSVPQRKSTPPFHLLGKSVILSLAARGYKGSLTLGS